MFEDWFRQLPSDEDGPKPEEIQTLKDLLNGVTSAPVAADRFTSVTSNEEDPEEG
ncbi:MAG: hypothetical protein M1830_010811 [Pleopsidium flavum]|nr:MAG: hypothetical protein M1830_010811 [Pleopsidium flavum]